MADKILLLIDVKHDKYMIAVTDHAEVEADLLTRAEMIVELSEILHELKKIEEEYKYE